jgi:GntR family transcriptional regulator
MTIFSQKLPLWYQLSQLIRAEIINGNLGVGSRIEPETELATKFDVSVITVRQALKSLEAEGLITRQRGRGTFVHGEGIRAHETGSPTPLESMFSKEFDPPAKILERGISAPPKFAAENFDQGEKLFFIRRVAYRDGIPWSCARLWVPERYKPKVTTRLASRYPMFRILAERCGVHFKYADFAAQALQASPEIAQHLEIDPFSPVLLLTGKSFDRNERAVCVLQIYFRSDHFSFNFQTRLDLPDERHADLHTSSRGYPIRPSNLRELAKPARPIRKRRNH